MAQQPVDYGSNLTWVSIVDFTPGIVSNTNLAYTASSNVPVPSPAPGTAQPFGTYACIALPRGGLAPLPGISGTFTPYAGAVIAGRNNYVTGFFVYGRLSGYSDEILYALDVLDAGNNRSLKINRIRTDGGWNSAIVGFGPSPSVNNTTATYAFTGGLTYTIPGNPTVPPLPSGTAGFAFLASLINDAASQGATPFFGIYPNPATPGAGVAPANYTPYLPGSTGNKLNGIVLTHSNRIIFLQQNEYLWTTATDVLAGEFESWYYTDPISTRPDGGNTALTMQQNTMFINEHPVGISTFESVNYGELFMVKRTNGGFLVQGDIPTSSLVWLGGITPTYGLDHTAASTPIGIAYLSNNNGVWLWSGGSTAAKISAALNDDFYQAPMPPNIGPKCNLVPWGKLLVTPNNYVYDTDLGGWWKLDNQPTPYCWYGVSWEGQSLYAAPSVLTTTSQPIATRYSKSTPANIYSWTSYPIPLPNNDRMVRIREVVVRAVGIGDIMVTFTPYQNPTGSPQPPIITTPDPVIFKSTSQPVLQRQVVNVLAQDVTVNLYATGALGGPAPIIYSINIGYEDAQLAGRT